MLCSDLDLFGVVSAHPFWGFTQEGHAVTLSVCPVMLRVMLVLFEQNGVWRFLLTPFKVVSTLVNK